jgi:hypothetical protein
MGSWCKVLARAIGCQFSSHRPCEAPRTWRGEPKTGDGNSEANAEPFRTLFTGYVPDGATNCGGIDEGSSTCNFVDVTRQALFSRKDES